MIEPYPDPSSSANTLGEGAKVTIANFAAESADPLLDTDDATEASASVVSANSIGIAAAGATIGFAGVAVVLNVNASYNSPINQFSRGVAHQQINALEADISGQHQAVTDAQENITGSGSGFRVIYNAASKQIARDKSALPHQYAALKQASPNHLGNVSAAGVILGPAFLGVWAAIAIRNRLRRRRSAQ
jgi:hypothetical protein